MRKSARSNWIEWWDNESIVGPETWHKNMDIFVTATDSLLGYSSQDILLDIGSGPGYLASFLKDRVREIHCLDTSQRYIDRCNARLAGHGNIFTYKLARDNYTDFSFLREKQFSIIICLSVVQYYKDVSEVENLIKEVERIAAPGARLLIADMPVANGVAANTFRLLKGALRKRRLLEVSSMLIHAVATKKHREAYLSLGLLEFSDKILLEMIGKLNLKAQVLRDKLTVNENRRHLLIML